MFRRCLWAYKKTHTHLFMSAYLRTWTECEVLWSQQQRHMVQIMCIHVISRVYVNPVENVHDGCLRYVQLASLPTSWINAQCVHSANSNWCLLSTQFTYIRRHCIAKGPFTHSSAEAERWEHNYTDTRHVKIHFGLTSVFLFYFFRMVLMAMLIANVPLGD